MKNSPRQCTVREFHPHKQQTYYNESNFYKKSFLILFPLIFHTADSPVFSYTSRYIRN